MFERKNIDSRLIDNRIIDNIENEYYKIYDNVVLTCYMTSKKDPQRNIHQDSNNYDYIKPWYETMKKMDLHGIIFYDTLSDEFVKQYQTDKIIFKKSEMGSYSINDERFIIYYRYLQKNPYKNVLMTDVSDVFIMKNPFDLINSDKTKIYVGTNVVGIGADRRTPIWFERRAWKIDPFNNKLRISNYDETGFTDKKYQIYSAGLIGGEYDKMMWLLENMIEVMLLIKSSKNYNMILLNYILNRYLMDEYDSKTFCTKYIFTGKPYNSLFGKNENMENTECCLYHK